MYVLLKFNQYGPKKDNIFFKTEKRPNQYISRKLFLNRSNGNPEENFLLKEKKERGSMRNVRERGREREIIEREERVRPKERLREKVRKERERERGRERKRAKERWLKEREREMTERERFEGGRERVPLGSAPLMLMI
jgi:hypothetical protein